MTAIQSAAEADDQRLQFLEEPLHPGVRALDAYWHGKRGARAMPDRGDISPAEIVRFLPNIILSEVVDEGRDFRVRIFGTALVALIGREMTGQLISQIAGDPRLLQRPAGARDRSLTLMTAAYRAGRPLFATGKLINMVQRSLEWHSFSSPLTTGGTKIGQMLGALFVAERPGD